MFKIGDFSKINRLTVKTLRLYDELNLLKPEYVDPENGYRYYDTTQLARIQKIIALKQIGFSLSDIGSLILDDVDFVTLLTRLQNKKSEIAKALELESNKLQQLDNYIETLRKEPTMQYDIILKDLPAITVAAFRKTLANYQGLQTMYPEMCKLMEDQKLECAHPEYSFTIYHDHEWKETNIDVEICESISKRGIDQKGDLTFRDIPAVPTAACLLHKGAYETLGKAYAAITKWVEDNGYEFVGEIRECYHDGCWNKEKPEDYLTELQAPVIKKR